MSTRMNKWKWLRDNLKEESECIEKIVNYDKREHRLDELFGNPIKQLEEIMGVNNESNTNDE